MDGLGRPLKLTLTGGHTHDVTQAPALLEGLSASYLLADKAYDSAEVVELIVTQDATPVIPSLKTRANPRDYDRERYKGRNVIERFYNRIKQFRRVATRYEKTARNFLSMVTLASLLVWVAPVAP